MRICSILDENGSQKVRGGLASPDFDDETNIPVKLLAEHQFAILIRRNSHQKMNHRGLEATPVHGVQTFWMIDAIQMVRQTFANCIKCFRYEPRATTHLKVDFPKETNTPISANDRCWA